MKKYYKIIDEEKVFFEGNILVLDTKIDDQEIKSTIMNPTDEEMILAGWIEYTPSEEELLQEAISSKILEIIEYDNSDNVNSFTINNIPMWLNHELRQQIKTSVDAYVTVNGGDVTVNITKWFGGNLFTFSAAAWLQMLAALEVYAAEALNVTEAHKAYVKTLTNIQDVENYDITQDYPAKLEFTS